jgi:hypothetical protein
LIEDAKRLRYMFDEFRYRRTTSSEDAVERRIPSLEVGGQVRIAVVSTPRSGGTWASLVVQHALDLVGLTAPHPGDLDWLALPDRALIHLHWPRTPYLQSLLDKAGVQVVTIIRHPFDVMLSVLRFAQMTPATADWLWGEAGSENILLDADPTSPQFAQWAMSERAAALVDVSRSWAACRGVVSVRYESLIASPDEEFSTLLQALGVKEMHALAEAIERYSPARVNRIGFGHSWLASSGVWQELFTSDLVDLLLARYRGHLQDAGYSTEISGVADREEALKRWIDLSATSGRLEESAYEAKLQVIDAAASQVPRASTATFLVKVENRGTVRWPAERRHPRVLFGCQWFRFGTDNVVALEGRWVIQEALPPGGVAYQTVTFPTPDEPGTYRLQIDLVHEHVRWFERVTELTLEVS